MKGKTMKKVLVAYATMSLSIVEVALAIGEDHIQQGNEPDILPLEKVTDLAPYVAIILVAPMVLSWHLPSISKFTLQVNPVNKPPLSLLADAGIFAPS
jgi:menaquinone-dependent protoporphyrinogen IX oxidase